MALLFSTALNDLSDLEVARRLQSDTSSSNPIWNVVYERVTPYLRNAITGSPTLADRDDYLGDALERLVVEVRASGITDTELAFIGSPDGGLREWALGLTRRGAWKRNEERRAEAIGVSHRHVYVPGKRIQRLISEGHTLEEAAEKLCMSLDDAKFAADAFAAANEIATIRITDDSDESGVSIPGGHASAAESYEESASGLRDALTDSFGSVIDDDDLRHLLYRALNDCGAKHESDPNFDSGLRRATRRIRRVAQSREDVLAILRGYKEVAA